MRVQGARPAGGNESRSPQDKQVQPHRVWEPVLEDGQLQSGGQGSWKPDVPARRDGTALLFPFLS